MERLTLVRALAFSALGLALLGIALLLTNGIGGVQSAPGARRSLFSEMSALQVGLVVFGPPMLAAVAALVLARSLPPPERRRARAARVVAWVVVALPALPPLLFMAAMSTM